MNCVGNRDITAYPRQKWNSVEVIDSWLVYVVLLFPQPCSAGLALSSSSDLHFSSVGSTLEDWYKDHKCVMPWSMKPITVGRVVLKEGEIKDFLVQVSELQWSLFPCSTRQLVSHDRESHPTALNTCVWGGEEG